MYFLMVASVCSHASLDTSGLDTLGWVGAAEALGDRAFRASVNVCNTSGSIAAGCRTVNDGGAADVPLPPVAMRLLRSWDKVPWAEWEKKPKDLPKGSSRI